MPSSALLDQCGSQSMLPLKIPGLENLLLVVTLVRKMMKDELSRQEKTEAGLDPPDLMSATAIPWFV